MSDQTRSLLSIETYFVDHGAEIVEDINRRDVP